MQRRKSDGFRSESAAIKVNREDREGRMERRGEKSLVNSQVSEVQLQHFYRFTRSKHDVALGEVDPVIQLPLVN